MQWDGVPTRPHMWVPWCPAAQSCRVLGSCAGACRVTYTVNRNINYTNRCIYACQFCAFSKGKIAEDLRGPSYLLSMAEITRRTAEAWDRGATEVCMQGGIHPDFTGMPWPTLQAYHLLCLQLLHGPERPNVFCARANQKLAWHSSSPKLLLQPVYVPFWQDHGVGSTGKPAAPQDLLAGFCITCPGFQRRLRHSTRFASTTKVPAK